MKCVTVKSIIVVLAGLIIFGGQGFAASKVEVTEPTFNFGKIIQHAVLTKRFWIRNSGSSSAKIAEIKPDCGCVDVIIPDSLIKPKDSIPVNIQFHTRNFLGFMTKKPGIKLEGATEEIPFVLYAEIIVKPENASPLVVTPAKVDVSQFSSKPRRRGVFSIVNNGIQDFQIKIIDSSFKSFKVELPAVIKSGEKIEGRVLVDKDKIAKSFEESFTFFINDGNQTRYSVPIVRTYLVKDSTTSK
jgi:hypothetical protein